MIPVQRGRSVRTAVWMVWRKPVIPSSNANASVDEDADGLICELTQGPVLPAEVVNSSRSPYGSLRSTDTRADKHPNHDARVGFFRSSDG